MMNKDLAAKFDSLVREYLDGAFLEFSRSANKEKWLDRIAKIESAIALKNEVAELKAQLPENSWLVELTKEQMEIDLRICNLFRQHTDIWRSIR